MGAGNSRPHFADQFALCGVPLLRYDAESRFEEMHSDSTDYKHLTRPKSKGIIMKLYICRTTQPRAGKIWVWLECSMRSSIRCVERHCRTTLPSNARGNG